MNKPSNNIYLKRRPFYNFNSLSFTAIFFLQFLQDVTNNRNNAHSLFPMACSHRNKKPQGSSTPVAMLFFSIL